MNNVAAKTTAEINAAIRAAIRAAEHRMAVNPEGSIKRQYAGETMSQLLAELVRRGEDC